jgi:hypothetical protein
VPAGWYRDRQHVRQHHDYTARFGLPSGRRGQPDAQRQIWRYSIAKDTLELVARHDPARFGDLGVPATPPFNQDEESSGIIPVYDILGEGWFLYDVQAHYNPGDAELVEGGQLVAIHFPPGQEK